jgi:hypothetical protein
MENQVITLKWGTLKGWHNANEEAMKLLKRYHDDPVSMSVMTQMDTPNQKQILRDLVSLPDTTIYLDWDGKYVTAAEAIAYLDNYGKSA